MTAQLAAIVDRARISAVDPEHIRDSATDDVWGTRAGVFILAVAMILGGGALSYRLGELDLTSALHLAAAQHRYDTLERRVINLENEMDRLRR